MCRYRYDYSPQSKDDEDPQDYVHHLFNYPYSEVIRDDSYRLDGLLYDITSPLSKLLVTESSSTFNTGSFIQYVKYEDLILRVVSKQFPYIKKITFKTMEDPNDQQYSYLKVVAHVDINMISEWAINRGDIHEYDYIHYMFREEILNSPKNIKTIEMESLHLDDVLYNLTSPLTKLIVPNHHPDDWGSHTQYVIMS
jgi:hypothetical protein